MALHQSLQQKLLQKLSPQQIQLMKLLQVPTANLEERIKEELEENPALEMSDDGGANSVNDETDWLQVPRVMIMMGMMQVKRIMEILI
jgi:RNA polymerase sigma-54 factor